MTFGSNIRVYDIMGEAVTCQRDVSMREAATLMNSKNVRSIIVMDDDAPIGIITESDFVDKAAYGRWDFESSACSIMTTPVISTRPEELISSAGRKMSKMNVRCLPVIAKGELIGMISESDLAKLSPLLIENAAERSGICTKTDFKREPLSIAGYCENCENYSYDLRQTGAASGNGPLLCAECRDIFARDPID